MAISGQDQEKKQEMNNHDETQNTEQQVEEELVYPPLRQSSFYSLTLGEIQEMLLEPGKSFGSMHMDEFLANICGVDDPSQLVITGSPAPGLQRQSSITIPAQLFGKTIKQVWEVIHRHQQLLIETLKQASPEKPIPREQSLGDMTLEDFLVKAGVLRETFPDDQTPPRQTNRNLPTCVHGHVMAHAGVLINGVNGCLGSTSSDMLLLEPVGSGKDLLASPSRKRFADEAVEKMVQRRQRRMIKNRESAARSRARKQAYTLELEGELNQLREENTHLREEEARVLARRRQLITQIMDNHARIKAMKTTGTLRRSNSCSW